MPMPTTTTHTRPAAAATHQRPQPHCSSPSHVDPRSTTLSWRALSFASVLLVAVSFGVYANSLDGRFAFDDNFAIVNNADARCDGSWSQLWLNDFWGQDIGGEGSHKSYRPLTVLSFRLNHCLHEWFAFGARNSTDSIVPPAGGQELHLWHQPSNTSVVLRPSHYTQALDQLGSRGYHIGNVLLHACVAILVVPLAMALLNEAACPRPFGMYCSSNCTAQARALHVCSMHWLTECRVSNRNGSCGQCIVCRTSDPYRSC
jgi:hypothetical protein